MFGKVLKINENYITLENIKKATEANLIGLHVIFEDDTKKTVGEILSITEEEINILLIGEIRNDLFTSGILKKPSFKNSARLIYKNELELILGSQNVNSKNNVLIGKSSIYETYFVTANINDLLAGHFTIIGNTGSGKSCGVARILQNLFYYNDEGIPENAHIVLFDVYGEYNRAFSNINKLPGLQFKTYSSRVEFTNDELVRIPAYFLEVDDLALLLNATEPIQLPIIEQALKLVYVFNSQEESMIGYKNDIIAKSLLDILMSGKAATQIRDQIVAVLTQFNTETLNLNTIISQPGYNRTLRQCLNIDNQGKMASVNFVIDFLDQFTKIDLQKIEIKPEFVYSLEDLYDALEFALIGEGILSNESIFEKANILKTRLHAIINSEYKQFFEVKEPIGKNNYVEKFFQTREGDPVQIVNMCFNHIDERFAKVLTKIFAKLFFNYATKLPKRATFPIHLILEEAHRYVQVDTDLNLLGYNIFDRITKEGRKYGVILGFITQRPHELSKTALSQCSNFIVFRMFHPEDINIISSMSSNITSEIIEKLKTLRPGMAVCFGTAFKIPQIVKLDLPEPMPESTNVALDDIWYPKEEI